MSSFEKIKPIEIWHRSSYSRRSCAAHLGDGERCTTCVLHDVMWMSTRTYKALHKDGHIITWVDEEEKL
jgi:hypothetical protein